MNRQLIERSTAMLERIQGWLNRHSVDVLRVSLGLVFLGFGLLKFFPGVSPAEDLAIRTVDTLTFGIVSGQAALFLTAAVESFIGFTLVSGKMVRTGLSVLAVALVGILSPLVLFFGDLFPSAPTLEAQYVFKDIVLAAAAMVIGATTLGSRLRPD
ncbi:MAG: DoxX family membrane protein [Acidimicrobiia bacterium]|nr:DoxX family membrane protein [Acidimicrobiia bacterium]